MLIFLTNLMQLAASTIAAIYKERWQIELLFKALKQHLRTPQDQDVCGHERERGAGADLDCADRHGVAEVPAAQVHVAVESIESGGVAPLQSVDVSGPVGLAQCTL